MNNLVSNLVRLYKELQELAREQQQRLEWDGELEYHLIGHFAGLVEANENAARRLRAVLESSGIDVDQESPLLKETTTKFLLEQASDHTREEIVELTTLEQLLELIVAEDCYGSWPTAVVVTKITAPGPDVKWSLTIYDSWLEL